MVTYLDMLVQMMMLGIQISRRDSMLGLYGLSVPHLISDYRVALHMVSQGNLTRPDTEPDRENQRYHNQPHVFARGYH